MVRMKTLQQFIMECDAIVMRKAHGASFMNDFYLDIDDVQKQQPFRGVP